MDPYSPYHIFRSSNGKYQLFSNDLTRRSDWLVNPRLALIDYHSSVRYTSIQDRIDRYSRHWDGSRKLTYIGEVDSISNIPEQFPELFI